MTSTATSIQTPEEDALEYFLGYSTASGQSHSNLRPDKLLKSFSPFDYCLFSAMLAFSALIGVYFAFCAKQKQNTTSEYLMGGKNMGIIPVSMSLVASFISGITLLGMPAEMYTYGTQYCTVIFGVVLATTACGLCFMPVFYKLQLNTSYEYLEVRFDRKVRLLGSILFLISCFLYIPIVIYLPALAFSQVTGVNIHLITPIVCLVCIFYTSLGGLKAVVWTDALQTVMMFGGMLVVIWIGTAEVGGFVEVWKRNENSGRIEFFNMNIDPTIRHTFWNTALGASFSWITIYSVNQAMVQRFLAMPTIERSQIMLIVFSIGAAAITVISFYAGLLIYASYYDCDLVSTKIVKASDQVLPYFVMDVASVIPGLPGLFMAGVFSAALSSMSTGLNSMSGVIYEDFIQPNLKVKISEERASFIMKVICALIGVLCVCMVFIVEQLGAVVQVSGSMGGITNGPMLAIFVLGMFFPWTNAKGAFAGGIVGLLGMGCISIGAQTALANGNIIFEKKPVSTEGCPSSILNSIFNSTILSPSYVEATQQTESLQLIDQPMILFRLSYTLYTLIGLGITIAVGLMVSFATGPTDPADVHIDLLTPVLHPWFAHRCKGGGNRSKWRTPESVEVVKEKDEVHNLLTTHNEPDSKCNI